MHAECLVCGAPVIYRKTEERMECALCHAVFPSKTCCVNGHYVCDDCHTAGLDAVISSCLKETSKDPVEIADRLMKMPFCHMHGPEHHVIVGAALLTAFANAGGKLDLTEALTEMAVRGKSVPGGICGFWGACGAGISSGICVAVLSQATPLTDISFGLANQMTAKALERIGSLGGPRCCKRDSYLSLLTAADFLNEHFASAMECSDPVCRHSDKNAQCIREKCPFFQGPAKTWPE